MNKRYTDITSLVGLWLLLFWPGSSALAETELGRVSAGLQPGQWAELNAQRPGNLMKVFVGHHPSGKKKTLHIAGWTDDGKWDSQRRQFLFMGYRIRHKFIAYSEVENRWQILPGPFGWGMPGQETFPDDRDKRFGHVYGRNALDTDNGIYHFTLDQYTYAYDLSVQRWSRFRGGSYMSIEYFPGVGLLSHKTKPGKDKSSYSLERLNSETNQWQHHANLPFSGYHAFAHYNPIRDEMIFMAGNDNRGVATLDRQGTVRVLNNLPFDITIRTDKVVVDPQSGLYLIFHNKALFELNASSGQIQQVPDYRAPWGKYEMPVPAPIPDYGVIIFVDRKTLLYRHKPITQ